MSKTESNRVVCITPARNEEGYIGGTIDSMISQDRRPDLWLIINDCSKDETSAIVNKAARGNSWMRVIDLPDRDVSSRRSGSIGVTTQGLQYVKEAGFNIAGIVDADTTFEPTALDQVVDDFTRKPSLGILGGQIVEQNRNTGNWEPPVELPPEFVRATWKFYREKCLTDINGIQPMKGWNAIDNAHAQMYGWDVYTDAQIQVEHHRPRGKRDGIRDHWKAAHNAYYMGTDPELVFRRALWRMSHGRPIICAGTVFLAAYLNDVIRHQPQHPDEALRQHIGERHKQIRLAGYTRW